MNPPSQESYDADREETNRRFTAIENELAQNTEVTKKLAGDTAELVEMWKDAGIFFKWMRRFGAATVWTSKVVLAIGAVYAGIRYGWKGDK